MMSLSFSAQVTRLGISWVFAFEVLASGPSAIEVSQKARAELSRQGPLGDGRGFPKRPDPTP